MTTEEDRTRRELGLREHDLAAREAAVSDREELDRLRDVAFRAQEELARSWDEARRARERLEEAQAERDRLTAEVREVNESLVHALLSARALAEEAAAARVVVAASEERFRSLVTTSAAIVCQADALGRACIDAEQWRQYTGLDAHGWTRGDEWLDPIHPQDLDAVKAAWAAAVAGGGFFLHQYRLRRADGSYTWVVARGVPIPSEGPVREWIGMVIDVSDRVRVDEAREQFIAILGHDLRSPLSIVMLGAQMLETESRSPESAQIVGQIKRGAQRMEAMIRDLLDFARGRLGGGIPIVRASIDLRQTCADAVSATRLAHPKRDLRCEMTGDLRGDWDRDRLEQVFANLLDNAVRHGAGPIGVDLGEVDGDVTMTVASGGAPIPVELLPGIFEPFHGRERSHGEGLGLGLFIVKEIIRAHGGVITVRSSEAEGTAFTARWPKRAATVVEGAAPG